MPSLPQSPPAPVIPVGLATRLLQIVGAAFAVVSGVTAIVNGEVTADTVYFAVIAAANFLTLAAGRYVQAAFAFLAHTWELDGAEVDVPATDDPAAAPADADESVSPPELRG